MQDQLFSFGVSLRGVLDALLSGDLFPIPGGRGRIRAWEEANCLKVEILEATADIALIAQRPFIAVPEPRRALGIERFAPQEAPIIWYLQEAYLDGARELRLSIHPDLLPIEDTASYKEALRRAG